MKILITQENDDVSITVEEHDTEEFVHAFCALFDVFKEKEGNNGALALLLVLFDNIEKEIDSENGVVH